jgi:hypothetical protein
LVFCIFIFREISTDYRKVENTIQKIESKEFKTGRTIAAFIGVTGGLFVTLIIVAVLSYEPEPWTLMETEESETWYPVR